MFLMPLSTKCFYVIVILVMFWLPVNFSIDAFQESLENRLLTDRLLLCVTSLLILFLTLCSFGHNFSILLLEVTLYDCI